MTPEQMALNDEKEPTRDTADYDRRERKPYADFGVIPMSNEPTDDVRQGLALLALARQAAAARAAMNAATERKEMMDSQRHAAVELAHQAAVDYQHHEDAYLAALEGVSQ